MSFVEVNIQKKIQEKNEQSLEFREKWKETREEYRLIEEMITLRKAENLTQRQLAEQTGNRQQVISRIEKRESSPTLRTFCNILRAMGYELKIVKRKKI